MTEAEKKTWEEEHRPGLVGQFVEYNLDEDPGAPLAVYRVADISLELDAAGAPDDLLLELEGPGGGGFWAPARHCFKARPWEDVPA